MLTPLTVSKAQPEYELGAVKLNIRFSAFGLVAIQIASEESTYGFPPSEPPGIHLYVEVIHPSGSDIARLDGENKISSSLVSSQAWSMPQDAKTMLSYPSTYIRIILGAIFHLHLHFQCHHLNLLTLTLWPSHCMAQRLGRNGTSCRVPSATGGCAIPTAGRKNDSGSGKATLWTCVPLPPVVVA